MKQTGITNMTITMSYKVCQFNIYMASCNLTVGSMDDTHIFAIAVWNVAYWSSHFHNSITHYLPGS